MKIYIASSWRNQHAVEMLTRLLREKGHTVMSWIENNYGENHGKNTMQPFEAWLKSESAGRAFKFGTEAAATCDVLIYVGVGGKDAATECGIAYANGAYMIALWAKGEDFGLMRKMFGDNWFERYDEVLSIIDAISTDFT